MKKYRNALSAVFVLWLLIGVLRATIQVNAWKGVSSNYQVETPEPNSPYFRQNTITLADGKSVDEYIINGPSSPSSNYERISVALPQPDQEKGIKILSVPAYEWVFGCSAVSAAMIAAYFDRTGYSNIYTGPTNGGVMPLYSNVWPYWTDNYSGTYPNNPLVASHLGLDGRTTRGSIDDYWAKYNSTLPDPFITYGWPQHTWGDAIGDFMKTSQSSIENVDGATTFYNLTSSPSPLTCDDMFLSGISTRDGTYGRKLFYEARGYTVTDCYNQKTDNNGGGFTFARYKDEIDAGHPVLLNLNGHSIAGIGYDDSLNTIYLHDTWDYETYTMPWGGHYLDLSLMSVSIVNLSPLPAAFDKISPENGATGQLANPLLDWEISNWATSYEYCLDISDDIICDGIWTSTNANTSVSLSGLLNGTTYYWQVRARNSAGITEADNNIWWTFTTVNPTPSVTNFFPGSGFVGTNVTLTGFNLSGTTSVSFNNVSASYTVDSATTIHASVPFGAATGKISVTTPAGTATSSSDFTVLPSVQFSAPTFTVSEAAGTTAIPVTVNASSGETITVNYATSDIAAVAGIDYTSSIGSITFPTDMTFQTIFIEVIDDALDEPDTETMMLTLSDPTKAALGSPFTATLIIQDNDDSPMWKIFLPLIEE